MLFREILTEYILAQALVPRTSNTIVRTAELRAEVERIRQCGYAVDDEEFEEGLKRIAAPVRERGGQAEAAIGIAGPVSRLGRSRMSAVTKSVLNAAAGVSEVLGYRPGESELQ